METKTMNCIMCPMGCEMTVTLEDGKFVSVTGNSCPRGAKYAETEVTDPRRMLTTTIRIYYHAARFYPDKVIGDGDSADPVLWQQAVEQGKAEVFPVEAEHYH